MDRDRRELDEGKGGNASSTESDGATTRTTTNGTEVCCDMKSAVYYFH